MDKMFYYETTVGLYIVSLYIGVYRTVKSLLRLRIGLTLVLNEISLSKKYARLSPRTIFTSEVRHPNDRVITQYQTTQTIVEVAST